MNWHEFPNNLWLYTTHGKDRFCATQFLLDVISWFHERNDKSLTTRFFGLRENVLLFFIKPTRLSLSYGLDFYDRTFVHQWILFELVEFLKCHRVARHKSEWTLNDYLTCTSLCLMSDLCLERNLSTNASSNIRFWSCMCDLWFEIGRHQFRCGYLCTMQRYCCILAIQNTLFFISFSLFPSKCPTNRGEIHRSFCLIRRIGCV